jgi:hypothetical protein
MTTEIERGGPCVALLERRVKPFGLLYPTNANPFGNISIIKCNNVEGEVSCFFLTTNKS